MNNRNVVPRYKKEKPEKPLTKEEFMIQWVLLRASFRAEFSGVSAVEAASDAWDRIQKLK